MYKVINRGTGRFEVSDPEARKYAATFDKHHEALAFAQYKNTGVAYHFSAEQLDKLLHEVLGLSVEYRDRHGRTEQQAFDCAVRDVLEGLSADRELYLSGEDSLKLQLLFWNT